MVALKILFLIIKRLGLSWWLVVKNPPVSIGDAGDTGSILGLQRSPGGGNGNPLQSSCLEKPTDRGAWRATVRGVTKESDTTEHTVKMDGKGRE